MFSWILFVDLQNNALCLVLLAWNAECVENLSMHGVLLLYLVVSSACTRMLYIYIAIGIVARDLQGSADACSH